MNFTFITSSCNWHQKPFSDKMSDLTDFTFFETVPPKEFMGKTCETERTIPGYVVPINNREIHEDRVQENLVLADVVIISCVSEKAIVSRLKQRKLTFKYAERFYKNGTPKRRFLRDAAAAWLHHGRFQKYPLYMLCASAYTAGDAARFGNYRNRCYKWGYFPETKHYDTDTLMEGKRSDVPTILWAGRFLNWKHPERALLVADHLKKKGYRFVLNMIGAGGMEEQLKTMIREMELSDCVHMLGSMTPGEVRVHMEQASIYLFTSDRGEGWGAVLNEAMNSGCAVVADRAIGSVPFLLKDGENGLSYGSGCTEQLCQLVERLMETSEERERLGRAAYRTMVEEWNAEEAARRLVLLSEHLLAGEKSPDLFASGPCSKAEVIKDWGE